MKTYKMLKSLPGSRDGLSVETFAKGKTYELNDSLAEQFFHQGAVEEVQQGEAGVPLKTQHIEELVSVARDK